MSAQVPSPQDISATAKAEGGPQQGSTSAQMQSQVGKVQNFEQAVQEVGQKMQTNPESITSEDANYLKSREARATGQAQPPKGSLSAEAQHVAAVNEGATTSNNASNGASVPPGVQSALDREANFQEAADQVGSKLARNPASVTKEDADIMHSREQRAHGHTDKGGIASQAQKTVAQNEK